MSLEYPCTRILCVDCGKLNSIQNFVLMEEYTCMLLCYMFSFIYKYDDYGFSSVENAILSANRLPRSVISSRKQLEEYRANHPCVEEIHLAGELRRDKRFGRIAAYPGVHEILCIYVYVYT